MLTHHGPSQTSRKKRLSPLGATHRSDRRLASWASSSGTFGSVFAARSMVYFLATTQQKRPACDESNPYRYSPRHRVVPGRSPWRLPSPRSERLGGERVYVAPTSRCVEHAASFCVSINSTRSCVRFVLGGPRWRTRRARSCRIIQDNRVWRMDRIVHVHCCRLQVQPNQPKEK